MKKLERKIKKLKEEIVNLGLVLPGSISRQFNVCGKPGCRCKDKENPRKHGPYHQLSFTVNGKSSSMFIRKEDLPEVKKRIKRHRKLRETIAELLTANVEFAKNNGFEREE